VTTDAGFISIRYAVVAERASLEALQFRASVHATRYAEQLRAHPEVVAIPVQQIEDGVVRVAERHGCIAGFAILLPPMGGTCELDAIFVEPDQMGTGVGRRLIDDAVVIARRWGARRIDVVANPDACGFYERLGFTGNDEVATRFGPGRRVRLTTEA
jgi:GNAT superfamily N-acetyltransferase